MVSTLRPLLFVLALQPIVACATDEVDDIGDEGAGYDGGGKADGVSSTSPTRLVDAPFYFSVAKTSVDEPIERSQYPYPTLWNPSVEGDAVGLRVIAVKQGTTVAAKQTARREMAKKLASAGVLKDGDIVLTFRPHLANTMAYPHIQMGTTHAGLVYTKDGAAYNIDSPLDGQYVGQFDTSHYAGNGGDDKGTDAMHIVRPRISDERRVQLRDWVTKLKSGLPRINGERTQIKFQSDYLVPAFVSAGKSTRQTVTTLGKIILEVDTTTKQPMYCSEFAWHMLALSACTADQIRSAGPEGASCVDDVFEPMPLVAEADGQLGLAEGPLLSLMKLPAEGRAALVGSIFTTGNASGLSSGHRAVAEQVAPMMGPLSQIFTARASGVPVAATAEGAGMLNAQVPTNYSPTAFLVAALGERADRVMDYVATVAFVGGVGYEKAKTLSHNPVP
ncbi:MAG: hypothetical protein ACKV2T_10235 [Kofleriaceae bacterium]